MPGITNWYNRTSMANRAQAAGAVVTNPTPGTPAAVTAVTDKPKDGKKHEALFGPNIGVVNSGPAWTDVKDKKQMAEELTPDVVQSWIARSKESTQPTTTLQALVNLKRPTIRLSPLSVAPNDDPNHIDSQHHHGLEFEYDCDAPKCGIYVHVLLSPDHPLAEPTSSQFRILLFETVTEGGFGKILKIEDGAMLELGRFEHGRHHKAPDTALLHPPPRPVQTPVPSETETPTPDMASMVSRETPSRPATSDSRFSNRRSRFSNFHLRRRTHNRSVSGPSLAVVDAEVAPAHGKGRDNGKDEHGGDGVKVTIRLAALDEQGTELSLPNEQVTYLQVVRVGPPPAENADDIRSWVVRVVKREATIGPHTFHLHEIYGLTSTTQQSAAPASANVESSHTYPPPSVASGSATVSVAHHILEDEPSSECLLCLSSPREVVLLPCRHLVACKECALNMVEFGAGGSITQPEAEVPAPALAPAPAPAPAAAATVDVEAAAATATQTTPEAATQPFTNTMGNALAIVITSAGTTATAVGTPAVAPRRKRKAKGWFCPVCRQPYTSLLRITTTSPVKDSGNRPSLALSEDTSVPVPMPETTLQASPVVSVPPPAMTRGGLSALRPSFLRNLSRIPSAAPDIERGVTSA